MLKGMIEHYLTAVVDALSGVMNFLVSLAIPLCICICCGVIGLVLIAVLRKDTKRDDIKPYAVLTAGYITLGLLVIVGWAGLRMAKPVARIDMNWRDAAEATTDSVPDAPPVIQTGPALASLEERTYSSTLTLPPDFMQHLRGEGARAFSQYLTDPSADDLTRLQDTFRRRAGRIVFTRRKSRVTEVPIPFADSRVKVQFEHLEGRAYNAAFEGRYLIRNATAKPITAQFIFNLPQAGTVRNLKVTVGDKAITDPDEEGAYLWSDKLGAGETREAVVTYRVIGARKWQYDLGSARRRVQHFQLDAGLDGAVSYGRGSLEPTAASVETLGWGLDNVVTAQQVAIVFPADTWARDGYLQVLSALPASFILFLLGACALGLRERRLPSPVSLAAALALFGFGLGATTVFAVYCPAVVAAVLGPVMGAGLATRVLGRRYLLAAAPAALFPVAFASAQNSGLLILVLVLLTLGVVYRMERSREPAAA